MKYFRCERKMRWTKNRIILTTMWNYCENWSRFTTINRRFCALHSNHLFCLAVFLLRVWVRRASELCVNREIIVRELSWLKPKTRFSIFFFSSFLRFIFLDAFSFFLLNFSFFSMSSCFARFIRRLCHFRHSIRLTGQFHGKFRMGRK